MMPNKKQEDMKAFKPKASGEKRESPPRPAHGKKPDHRKKAVLIGGIGAALIAAVVLGVIAWPRAPVTSEPSQPPVTTTEARIKNEYEGTTHKPWDVLLEENEHTIGWMEIGGTRCDNPVVLYSDNQFYLNHAYDKSKNVDGTLYVDYRCQITEEKMSSNLTIYGHNLRNGTMFGQVRRYRDLDFYKEHPIIKFDTLYGKYEWKIFSVFITNVNESDGEIFDYRQPEYHNFEEFAEQCKLRSLINCPVDVKEGDTIITLSTCTYELDNARLVVMARKTRDYEDKEVDVEKATVNQTPLYPDGWYRRYGGKKPEVPTTTPAPTTTLFPTVTLNSRSSVQDETK